MKWEHGWSMWDTRFSITSLNTWETCVFPHVVRLVIENRVSSLWITYICSKHSYVRTCYHIVSLAKSNHCKGHCTATLYAQYAYSFVQYVHVC